LVGAASLTIFSIVQWVTFSKNISNHKLAVYSIKGHSAIDLIYSRQAYFFADTALLLDKRKIDFHIRPNRIINGVSVIQTGENALFNAAFAGCKLTRCHGKNILYINDKAFDCPQQMNIDYCIVANDAVNDISQIQGKINVKTLIFDGSNTSHLSDAIITQARNSKIDIHTVLQEGAFITSI
jgi:hypothetical protein